MNEKAIKFLKEIFELPITIDTAINGVINVLRFFESKKTLTDKYEYLNAVLEILLLTKYSIQNILDIIKDMERGNKYG